MTRISLVAVLCVLLLFTTGIVLAFNEPDGFRGLPWGASEAQMRKTVNILACEDYPKPERWQGERFCAAEFTIGDVQVDAAYVFRGNKFVRVGLSFPAQSFGRVAEIFQERYGPPTTKGRDVLEWSGPNVAISVHRYLGQATRGYAALTTRAETKESKRLRDEQTKGAAKGL
jgi:hypothetical protein